MYSVYVLQIKKRLHCCIPKNKYVISECVSDPLVFRYIGVVPPDFLNI